MTTEPENDPTVRVAPIADPTARQRAQEAAIDSFIQASLQDPDPLQAVLGSTVGGLWDTAMLLDREINRALREQPDGFAAFEEVAPAMEMFLKIHRQGERYLHVFTPRAAR